MTNLEFYLPILLNNPKVNAYHYGIDVTVGMGDFRRICSFDTREEFIEWYGREYDGKTLDKIYPSDLT